MPDLDTREWLLTNGLGSFASGTISDVRTRTYHGWLFTATNPPSGRTLLFSHLDASLELSGSVVALGTNVWGNGQIELAGYELLRCFDINPVPKWIWGRDNWQLTRQLVMPYGLVEAENFGTDRKEVISHSPPCLQQNAPLPLPNAPVQFCDRILIQYRYDGSDTAILRLRLLIAERDFHHPQIASSGLQFSELLGQQQICLQAKKLGNFGIPWHLRWTKGKYQPDAVWYWNYGLSEETKRGLSDKEDLYSPGYLIVRLQPGDVVTLEARVGFPNLMAGVLTSETFAEAVEIEQDRLSQIFGWSEESKGAGGQGAG
ncbi:glycogen debranching enzyme N-terminal domain-containing protein, partial [Nostoc sp. LEGE 12450]|uniref:glycogen debranching enzyme N-terminal domain-containing protein n=1 Tax=Nostoc sp. LEGE 12450 TaxID=1828643 RepID=UPI0018807F2C